MSDNLIRTPSRLVLPATRSQLRVLLDPTRFQYVYASRRWGKSMCGVAKFIKQIGVPVDRELLWWVAPTYRQTADPFAMLMRVGLRAGLLEERGISRSEHHLRFKTGWVSEFRSADQPDNLRGAGVRGLVEDELAQISDETHNECLRPTLADKGGWYLGLGTPKGARGFGWLGYKRGQNARQAYERGEKNADIGVISSHRFTCEDAIFIPRDEIENARSTMPVRAFQQEFMAEFLDDVGCVFVNIRKRPRLTPISGESVGIGIDWAKKIDYTWFVAVGCRSGAVLECARYQRLPYPRQVELANEFYQKWRRKAPQVFVQHDQTGVGEALDDLLNQTSMRGGFEGVIFTEREKKDLVEEAVVDFESGKLGFIPNAEGLVLYDTLIKEHEDFALEVGKTGKISYGAPEGFHDDAVMATCLANRARRRVRAVATPGVVVI